MSTYKKPDLVLLAQSLHEDECIRWSRLQRGLHRTLFGWASNFASWQESARSFQNFKRVIWRSSLPKFGLMDIFNHLIMSKTEYDKDMLASWRSFDEYKLFKNGHVRSLQHKNIFDNDDSKFHVIFGQVIPTQKEKTHKGNRVYKLWFILKPNGSIYSAFCRCIGGADQGCRHWNCSVWVGRLPFQWKKCCDISACLLEPETYASNQTSSVSRDETFSFPWTGQQEEYNQLRWILDWLIRSKTNKG